MWAARERSGRTDAAFLKDRHYLRLIRRIHPPQLVAHRDDPRCLRAVDRREVGRHPVEHVFNAAVNVGLAVEGEKVHARRRARANIPTVIERRTRIGIRGDPRVADLVLREIRAGFVVACV